MFLLGSFSCAQTVTSQFNSDLEGWTGVNNGATTPVWNAAGGNPDGHASMVDLNSGWSYFVAPSQYLSQDLLYGGLISFDLRHTGEAPTYGVQVALQGGGITILNALLVPQTDWQSWNFVMADTDNWRVYSDISQNYTPAGTLATQSQIETVLASPTGFFILADYNDFTTGVQDVTYIDNVRVDVVPEPATLTVVGLCTAMLSMRKKKTLIK